MATRDLYDEIKDIHQQLGRALRRLKEQDSSKATPEIEAAAAALGRELEAGNIESIRSAADILLQAARRQQRKPIVSVRGKKIKGPKHYPTAFGRNIDKLKDECFWSYDDLADATGLDTRTILLHVNRGMMPRPSTMKLYAGAFQEALGRGKDQDPRVDGSRG